MACGQTDYFGALASCAIQDNLFMKYSMFEGAGSRKNGEPKKTVK